MHTVSGFGVPINLVLGASQRLGEDPEIAMALNLAEAPLGTARSIARRSLRTTTRSARGPRFALRFIWRLLLLRVSWSANPILSDSPRKSPLSDLQRRLGHRRAGATCFPAQCSGAVHQRETVAIDRYEHLVRYAGWYSNRARGERAKKSCPSAAVVLASSDEPMASEFSARARATWARLIRKVYEADPLECPQCKGPMRVIALIEDLGVIRRILEHLGQWAPLATERSPPPFAASWPRHANLPLTYHPVPDIA